MHINKIQVIEAIIRIVAHISDKEYQERVWIQGKGPECDDFDETSCNFFGDVDPVLENYTEYGITEEQYRILKNFRDEFDAFSDDNSWPPLFIDTPEWAKIMEHAQEVLKAFNYEKPLEGKSQ